MNSIVKSLGLKTKKRRVVVGVHAVFVLIIL